MPAIERLYREALERAVWLPPAGRHGGDFVAVSEGEAVHVTSTASGALQGFVSVWVADSFIHHLFVAPSFQRRGVASSLLASLRPWLPLPWRLKCVCANRSALAFYGARGWHDVGTGENEDGPYRVLEFARDSGNPPP